MNGKETDGARYKELMSLDKSQLVNLFLKSEKIRHRQNKIINKLEKELEEYEDISLEKMISEINEG